MFPTGSKLLIGSATLAWLGAAAYGVFQGGALGTIGLVSAAAALTLIAGINAYFQDSNVSAMDPDQFETCAAAQATARNSVWPLLVALGATCAAIGLVTTTAYFVVGLVVIAAGAFEWIVQGWSERVSADREFNDEAREVMADPLEVPVAGTILAAVVIYSFSRVMLGLPSKSATVIGFALAAAVVLSLGAFFGSRHLSKVAMTGVLSVGALALVSAGAFAGLSGERDIHVHETTGDLADLDECGTEETEADEKFSQTVSAKSNVAAQITYDGTDLGLEVPGGSSDLTRFTLPRANPNNILFRNDSSEPARLVVDLHPAVDADGVPLSPERACTAIVEEDGGLQLLTVVFTQPTFAVEDGFYFTVAGSDAELEVIVP